MMDEVNNSERVLLEGANWKELRFYQKSEALYQMTFVFCERFLPKHGDRTVDQIDVLMNGYLATLEDRFRKEGGMKERMYRVRTGYRAEQVRKMKEMEATIKWQEQRIKELEAELKRIKEDR